MVTLDAQNITAGIARDYAKKTGKEMPLAFDLIQNITSGSILLKAEFERLGEKHRNDDDAYAKAVHETLMRYSSFCVVMNAGLILGDRPDLPCPREAWIGYFARIVLQTMQDYNVVMNAEKHKSMTPSELMDALRSVALEKLAVRLGTILGKE